MVENRAAVDLRSHFEGNSRRQIRLDKPRDDVARRALRRHDKVDARGSRELRKAGYRAFDLLARDHHQVRQLVDYADDVRQLFLGDFKAVEEFGLFRIFGVDERSAFFGGHRGVGFARGLLRLFVLADFGVESRDVADIRLLENPVSAHHFAREPLERGGDFARVGDHGNEHMRQRIVHLHFDDLRVYHYEAQVVGRHFE